jgi:hypothetical protein
MVQAIRGFESHPLRFRSLATTRAAGQESSRFRRLGTEWSVAFRYSRQVFKPRRQLNPARLLITVISNSGDPAHDADLAQAIPGNAIISRIPTLVFLRLVILEILIRIDPAGVAEWQTLRT